jgi:hypothetical protein
MKLIDALTIEFEHEGQTMRKHKITYDEHVRRKE